MKISVTHRDTGTMPRMLGNKPLAGSGRRKVGEIVGRKEKKTLCSPFFFIQTLQRSDIKLFPPSSVTNRGQRPHRSNPSGKYFPREIIISITGFWQAGEVWRNIKKDLRIMILVSKLDMALQSNEAAKSNANVTCKSFPSQGISHTGWKSGELLFIPLAGHHHRMVFDVSWKAVNQQSVILRGQKMEMQWAGKMWVEGQQLCQCLLTGVNR